jgi:hypothetical protein
MVQAFALSLLLVLCAPAKRPEGPYLVLLDQDAASDYLPAAEALAALHAGSVRRFDPSDLAGTLETLRASPPRFVVFLLPPERIDVDLTHRILEMSTRVDDDPFGDFEYGFLTGRDGPAARRFVKRIEAAWKRKFGRKAALFGSWEGLLPPPQNAMSAFAALGFDAAERYVSVRAVAEARRKAAREALASFRGLDALLFLSHGFPDEMAACFRAADLRDWKVDLSPAVLVNCACYNGAPGRWYAPSSAGIEDKGLVSRDDSVALQLLDSGISAYFAGIDPWHGPLAIQVFLHLTDDGLRLGEAAKRMHDRLALEFLPERIAFAPALESAARFAGEGAANRRHNGAGMIFYGDPALAPFAKNAGRLLSAELETLESGKARLRLRARPLVKGRPGSDFLLPSNRLLDYYSVRSADFASELALEIYRVVPLPAAAGRKPRFRVASASSGGEMVPAGKPQLVVEETPWGDFLHVRVPLEVQAIGSRWTEKIAVKGIEIDLEGEL